MALSVKIEKQLGSFHLDMDFSVENETLAFLGASGCGKSLTLQCIAGIQRPDRGQIILDGVTLFDSERDIDLPPQARRTGLLFQNYALFPNMTVLENIQAGARREPDKDKRKAMVETVVEQFGLGDRLNHRPSQLSGGQQQRTALARILVSAPNILLLDEPFSALDNHLRFRLEQEVRQVIRSFGKTVLLVSHDRDEVFRLADHIGIVHNGRLEKVGPKDQVFRDPGTWNGAVLTGCKNLSRIQPAGPQRVTALDWGITLDLDYPIDGITGIGIRMHDIRLGPGPNNVLCQVVETIENPFSYFIMVRPKGRTDTTPLSWEVPKEHWTGRAGDEVLLSLPSKAMLPLRG